LRLSFALHLIYSPPFMLSIHASHSLRFVSYGCLFHVDKIDKMSFK
jgi:hypothetical protein